MLQPIEIWALVKAVFLLTEPPTPNDFTAINCRNFPIRGLWCEVSLTFENDTPTTLNFKYGVSPYKNTHTTSFDVVDYKVLLKNIQLMYDHLNTPTAYY